jgi:hypothetical protein
MADIFEVLSEMGELELGRGRVRGVDGGPSACAPMIAFRYRDLTPELARLMGQWVGEFPGEFRWHFDASWTGSNWVLAPQRLWDYAAEHDLTGVREARVVLIERDPDFGRRANAELERLGDFLRERWRHRRGTDGD